MIKIKIATDFTDNPGGAYREDGKFSGQEFREDFLVPALAEDGMVEIDLDGTFGYPLAFLKTAFEDLGACRERIVLISEEEPSLVGRIQKIIEMGFPAEDIVLSCECFSSEHSLFFHFDWEGNEIYTEMFLRNWRGFFKRLWVAIKYVFKRNNKYGHFDCFSMSVHAAYVLRTSLDRFLETAEKEKKNALASSSKRRLPRGH